MAGFQQLRVTRELDASGAVKIGISAQMGDVFYVDGNNGADGYGVQSRNWKYPLKTITKALTLCTNLKYDHIIVMDHYQEAMPISVNVSTVRIIALHSGTPWSWLTASTDTACMEIAADAVWIEGFEFGAGATHGAIEFNATKGYGTIKNCAFGWMQAGQDGIRVSSPYEAAGTTIEDCFFGNNLTRDGIRINHNMTRGLIRRNTFRAVPGIGINVANQMALGTIRDNRFMLPSDTAGKAITLGASTSGIYVVDNRANFGDTDSMATIPWVDGGTADLNTWDNNLTAGVVDYPA